MHLFFFPANVVANRYLSVLKVLFSLTLFICTSFPIKVYCCQAFIFVKRFTYTKANGITGLNSLSCFMLYLSDSELNHFN